MHIQIGTLPLTSHLLLVEAMRDMPATIDMIVSKTELTNQSRRPLQAPSRGYPCARQCDSDRATRRA